MKCIFLSHVEEDQEVALAMAARLGELGYSCWYYERDSIPGQSYLLNTMHAIDACQVFILLVSPRSMTSHQVDTEVQRAHEQAKHVIPVLLEINDSDYKRRRPLWAVVIGTNTSMQITSKTAYDSADRIAVGLRSLEIFPDSTPSSQGSLTKEDHQPHGGQLGPPTSNTGVRKTARTIYVLAALLLANAIGLGISAVYRVMTHESELNEVLGPAPLLVFLGAAPILALLSLRFVRFRVTALILLYSCFFLFFYVLAFLIGLAFTVALPGLVEHPLPVALLMFYFLAVVAVYFIFTVLIRRLPGSPSTDSRIRSRYVEDARAGHAFRLAVLATIWSLPFGIILCMEYIAERNGSGGALSFRLLNQIGALLLFMAASISPVGFVKAWLALRDGTRKRKRATAGLVICGVCVLSSWGGLGYGVNSLRDREVRIAGMEAEIASLSSQLASLGEEKKTRVRESLERGNQYRNGIGVDQDNARAAKFYRLAANEGSPEAMVDLGFMYEHGFGVDRDQNAAMNWYRKAADSGDTKGMMAVGLIYQQGNAIEKNEVEGANWYRRAAEFGNAQAMTDLGFMYEHGVGVDKDEGEAMNWYRKGADAGDAQGMTRLGAAYERGLGGKSANDAQAVSWYRKGAEAGNSQGMRALATMYAGGRGGLVKNAAEADSWYVKAADSGDVEAMKELARMYAKGDEGLAKDTKKAAYWSGKATAATRATTQP